MISETNEKLCQFKEDLSNLLPIQIVRKHIISGECFTLSPNQYFDLRSEVADHFGLHPNEVLVVGSAKLGFSVVPEKRYDPFGNESDIDVALVSSNLFDKVWRDVFSYKYEKRNWREYSEFAHYLFRGWIRPDLLPKSREFPFCGEWKDFFQQITRSGRYGRYKIVGALYKSYFFLENYQKICVQKCMDEAIGILPS